jgi:hypothetical protein
MRPGLKEPTESRLGRKASLKFAALKKRGAPVAIIRTDLR